MKHAPERAVYLAALAFASKERHEYLSVEREVWQAVSCLGRSAFYDGLRYCTHSKLLAYRKDALTLHDPVTFKPPVRWKSPRWIHHDDPNWEFDYRNVSAEAWQFIVEGLMRQCFPAVNHSGWTHASEEILCRHCRVQKKFQVSFTEICFKCWGCGYKGKLWHLVRDLLETDWDAVKQHIQAKVKELETAKWEKV